jgi:CubicO group peptidase (beta-lactamase class C family)
MRRIQNIFLINGFTILFLIAACVGGHKDRCKPLPKNASGGDKLAEIMCKAENIPCLKSFIVNQGGKFIIEKYMHGGGPDQLIDLKSASKSILSAVLGIAISEGYITSIDQNIMDFFPDYQSDDIDPRTQKITIRHLATMKSGFGVKESAKAYQRLYDASDWIGHILGLPIESNPGVEFNYLSFNTHLLSAIITRATGMSTLAYAKQTLFSPLTIDRVIWEQDPQGYCIGGWGLSMRARDMVKFGLLYLNDGKAGQQQVVPSSWIKQSTVERTGMIGTYYSRRDKEYGYGYLWWVKRFENTIDIPFASGHGGQRIAFISKANSVIVTQADPSVSSSNSHKYHRAIDSLLFEDLAIYLLQ